MRRASRDFLALRQPVEVRSTSAAETESLGRRVGESVRAPCVILLRGKLGTGKTTLARGIALGLGLRDREAVNSPSFTLVNIYRGRCAIYHVDLYRLEGERDLYSIGLDEFLGRHGVTIVEWAERLEYSDQNAICIDLMDEGGDIRTITLSRPDPAAALLQPARRATRDRRKVRRGHWRD